MHKMGLLDNWVSLNWTVNLQEIWVLQHLNIFSFFVFITSKMYLIDKWQQTAVLLLYVI